MLTDLAVAPSYRTLAIEGKREIDLFTWDRVAENTLDVYKELVVL